MNPRPQLSAVVVFGASSKAAVIEINPAMKKHWEREIKILRDAPRDAEKLREILKAKQKEYEKQR